MRVDRKRVAVLLFVLLCIATLEVHDGVDTDARLSRNRGIPLLFQHGEWIGKKAELPDVADFRLMRETDNETTGPTGPYYDIGYKWSGIKVLFIPVFTWSGDWCSYISDDEYLEASHEECIAEAQAAGIAMPSAGPGFWWSWGGKLIWLSLIGFFVFLKMKGAKEDRALAERQFQRRMQAEDGGDEADGDDGGGAGQIPVRRRRT